MCPFLFGVVATAPPTQQWFIGNGNKQLINKKIPFHKPFIIVQREDFEMSLCVMFIVLHSWGTQRVWLWAPKWTNTRPLTPHIPLRLGNKVQFNVQSPAVRPHPYSTSAGSGAYAVKSLERSVSRSRRRECQAREASDLWTWKKLNVVLLPPPLTSVYTERCFPVTSYISVCVCVSAG